MATPVANAIGLTGNPFIDGLTQGSAWQFGGGPRVITYSLSVNDTVDDSGRPLGGTWAQSPALQDAVERAFALWANVADITFQRISVDGVFSQSPADIAVVLTGNELGDEFLAVGIFPDPSYVDRIFDERTVYPHPEGDIAIDNYDSVFATLQQGSRGFGILVHEIGHALGLKHPDDDGGNGRPTFAQLGIAGYDEAIYTVMLSDWPEFVSIGHGPVLLDILAIQHIYGANTNYRGGDDTYSLEGSFQPRTLWDTGGIDVIDASSARDTVQFGGAIIDLRPGRVLTEGLSIAYGVVIENAIGTRGMDTIYGNDAANRLDGGRSVDRYYGGKGDDTYVVTEGDEIYENPGEGIDTVIGSIGTLPANVENNLDVGASGRVYGNSLDNTIAGSGERLSSDRLFLYGREGNDLLIGTPFDDFLFGEAGDDFLVAGDGEDILVGGPGNDRLDGGPSGDGMRGGEGDDVYVVSNMLPSTHLLFFSDPGVPIEVLAGIAAVTTDASATFHLSGLGDYTGDGFVDSVSFSLLSPPFGRQPVGVSSIQIITRQPGLDQTGRYVPGAAGDPAVPFLGIDPWIYDVSVSSFTVHEFVVDQSGASPTLERLWVSFERHFGSPDGPRIWGELRYGSEVPFWEPVLEFANEGTDTVESMIGYVLPEHVENLVLTGSAHITGMGNAAANVITGNAGHNVLVGLGGDDTLVGGAGYDTAEFTGPRGEYAFVHYLDSIRVVDRRPDRDGVDLTREVEQARFAGGIDAVFTASDVFTPLEYIASYADLIAGFGANAQLGYDHFVHTGRYASRTASFDGLAYLASQPDLVAGYGSNGEAATVHYINSGRTEGRAVSFNGLEYIASYADLIDAFGVNEDLGTHHFLSAGRNEGRAVTFRGLEYLASNADLMNGFGTNLELATIHYISAGRFEGRTSSFKALEYIASYPDLMQGIGPNRDAGALHYIESGRFEGRTEHFDTAQYLANYADLRAGFGTNHELAALHYIQRGFSEGRTDDVI